MALPCESSPPSETHAAAFLPKAISAIEYVSATTVAVIDGAFVSSSSGPARTVTAEARAQATAIATVHVLPPIWRT